VAFAPSTAEYETWGVFAALLVPADDADHQALAGGLVDIAQEGPAAGAVGVAATVELELASHRLPEPVLAGDRLVRRVRVADHLDQLTADRGAGGQPFAPVTFSTGTLDPGWLTRRKAKSSSSLDEDFQAWST
jgi:Uncharacterized protein related to methyl coenzyme M reductase subunit C